MIDILISLSQARIDKDLSEIDNEESIWLLAIMGFRDMLDTN